MNARGKNNYSNIPDKFSVCWNSCFSLLSVNIFITCSEVNVVDSGGNLFQLFYICVRLPANYSNLYFECRLKFDEEKQDRQITLFVVIQGIRSSRCIRCILIRQHQVRSHRMKANSFFLQSTSCRRRLCRRRYMSYQKARIPQSRISHL